MSPVSCSLELVQVLNFFLLFRSLTTYSRFFPVQLESQAGVLISSLLMPATADQPHLACIRCTDRLFRRTMQTLFSGSIADKRHMSFCVVGNFSSPRPFTQRTSRCQNIVAAAQGSRRVRTKKRHVAQRKKGQQGSAERPRLAVYKSNNHIYGQVIDDTIGHTLAAVSSLTKKVAAEGQEEGQEGSQETFLGANKEAAELVGKKLAELCLAKDIKRVFFDRGGFRYHGRIQAFADGAREGGLAF